MRDISAALTGGQTFQQCTREWLRGCAGPELLERWREQYQRVATTFADFEPDRRLPWVGPDMGARSFISARQMEVWAHGQAIFDARALTLVHSRVLKNGIVEAHYEPAKAPRKEAASRSRPAARKR